VPDDGVFGQSLINQARFKKQCFFGTTHPVADSASICPTKVDDGCDKQFTIKKFRSIFAIDYQVCCLPVPGLRILVTWQDPDESSGPEVQLCAALIFFLTFKRIFKNL
jgi:hypothetical protein